MSGAQHVQTPAGSRARSFSTTATGSASAATRGGSKRRIPRALPPSSNHKGDFDAFKVGGRTRGAVFSPLVYSECSSPGLLNNGRSFQILVLCCGLIIAWSLHLLLCDGRQVSRQMLPALAVLNVEQYDSFYGIRTWVVYGYGSLLRWPHWPYPLKRYCCSTPRCLLSFWLQICSTSSRCSGSHTMQQHQRCTAVCLTAFYSAA